jgi:hypothetical protein
MIHTTKKVATVAIGKTAHHGKLILFLISIKSAATAP